MANGFSTNTGQERSIHSKPCDTCNGVGVDNITPSGDIAANISFKFEKQGTSKEFMSSVGFGSTIATSLTSFCFEIALICLCPTNPAPTTASLIILVISFPGNLLIIRSYIKELRFAIIYDIFYKIGYYIWLRSII